MTRIKKFESFINEELNPNTYKSAAEKLLKKGHKSRAERIEKHSKEQVKNVKPITLEMYGEEFTLDHNNIIDIQYTDDNKGFIIDYDLSRPNSDYEDPNISDEENEQREHNKVFTVVEFLSDKNSRDWTKYIPDITGLIIPDRKNARKVLLFIQEYFNYYGGPLKDLVNTLTVNDLYEE